MTKPTNKEIAKSCTKLIKTIDDLEDTIKYSIIKQRLTNLQKKIKDGYPDPTDKQCAVCGHAIFHCNPAIEKIGRQDGKHLNEDQDNMSCSLECLICFELLHPIETHSSKKKLTTKNQIVTPCSIEFLVLKKQYDDMKKTLEEEKVQDQDIPDQLELEIPVQEVIQDKVQHATNISEEYIDQLAEHLANRVEMKLFEKLIKKLTTL